MRRASLLVLIAPVVLSTSALARPVVQVGSEFTVNTDAENDSHEAAVTTDATGNALFAWATNSDLQYRIAARTMSAAGVFLGPATVISDEAPPPYVARPRLATLGPSRYLAVWDSAGTSPLPEFAARGQVVNGLEDLDDLDFPVSEMAAEAYSPQVCTLQSGAVLVSWSGFGGSSLELAPWIRKLDSSGVPLTGDVRLDDSDNSGRADEHFVHVACTAQDRSVAIWLGENPDDRTELFVEGRVLGRDLEFLSPVFRVSESALADYYEPDVVMAPDGTFTVVFMGATDGGFDVLGRRFAPDGSPLGPSVVINDYREGGEILGDVASDSRGNFAVVWEVGMDAEGRYSEVYGRIFLANGTPYGPSFHLNPDPADDLYTDSDPAAALADSGLLTVAWQSWLADGDDFAVRGARFLVGCVPDDQTHCLAGGRFEVRSGYRTADGIEGAGTTIPLSTDSGGFWFFSPDNPELFVKILDGCAINGHYWVYAAGLTDVQVELAITDGWTGRVWRRDNELLTPFPPLQDVEAFDTCNTPALGRADPLPAARSSSPAERAQLEPLFPCVADSEHLCLLGRRFRASASYAIAGDPATPATAFPLGDQSGMFWFFWPENLELVVKVLDGCIPFDRFWIFAAGLTNVAVQLEVEDLATGAVRRYTNPVASPFQPIHDASAFATCR